MLSDIVSRTDSSPTIDWQNYHGAHWRTTLGILSQFEAPGHLTVQQGIDRVYAFAVTALAERALRERADPEMAMPWPTTDRTIRALQTMCGS